MNEIILICNVITYEYYKKYQIFDEYKKEINFELFQHYKIDLYRKSLIFIKWYLNKCIQYEIVESEPEIEPEKLYDYWRILYE